MASRRVRRARSTVDRAFGDVLRELRLERGLSQERLGHDAGSGRTYMSQLERGEKGPTLKMLFRLAHELDVSATEFVRLVEAAVERSARRRSR